LSQYIPSRVAIRELLGNFFLHSSIAEFTAGNYIARLTVYDTGGKQSQVSQNFTVGAPPPPPPAGPVFPVVIPFNGFTFTLAADKTFTYQ